MDRQVGACLDVTPNQRGLRGEEIQMWLMLHPEVEQYAILDDDDDMLPDQLPNLFQTSSTVGITEEIATAIENHFGPQTFAAMRKGRGAAIRNHNGPL